MTRTLLYIAACVALFAGCPATAPPDAGTGDDAAVVAPTEPAAADPPAARQTAFAPFTDARGRRWLTDGIPYDAYDTAPSAASAARTGRPSGADLLAGIGANVGTAEETGGMSGSSMTGGSPSAASDGEPGEWGGVITAERLRDEVKAARNTLAGLTRTVAAFNRDYAAGGDAAAVLAAAATIAAEHPGPIPFKESAPALRGLSGQVAAAATARGRTAWLKTRDAFLPLDAVLNGNAPPDGAANADDSRAIYADRAALMRRMQRAYDRLTQDYATASRLKDDATGAAAEASVLAALMEFSAHPDYDGAESEDYDGWAADLVAAGREATRAAEAGNFRVFDAAIDRAGQRCGDCHGVYRF